MEATPGSTGATSEMGAVSRLFNVYFSPAKTFESIGRKRGWDWLVPVVILIALSILGALIISPKLDVDDAVRMQMQRIEKMRPGMTDEDRAKIEEASRKGMKSMTSGPWRFITAMFVPIMIFFVPLLYHGIAMAWGKATGYLTVVAAYAYVQMVQVLKGILMIAVAAPRKSIGIMEINSLLKSNLGAFMNPETASRPLLTLASNVDIFEIWAIVVGAIALSRVTRLSLKGATFTVVGLWALWVCVQLAGAVIGAAFGG